MFRRNTSLKLAVKVLNVSLYRIYHGISGLGLVNYDAMHRSCAGRIILRMQARRALRHSHYWGGGKIEHLILCCHSVKTFAAEKLQQKNNIHKEKEKKSACNAGTMDEHPLNKEETKKSKEKRAGACIFAIFVVLRHAPSLRVGSLRNYVRVLRCICKVER